MRVGDGLERGHKRCTLRVSQIGRQERLNERLRGGTRTLHIDAFAELVSTLGNAGGMESGKL